jgi:hypothetical protein
LAHFISRFEIVKLNRRATARGAICTTYPGLHRPGFFAPNTSERLYLPLGARLFALRLSSIPASHRSGLMIVAPKVRSLVLTVLLGTGLAGCEHAKLAQENRTGGNLTGYGNGHGYGDGSSTGADYATLDKASDTTSEQNNHDQLPGGQDTTLRSDHKSARPLP